MAENKAEIKIEDKADYTEDIAAEYKNYSSVARKPFAGSDDKAKAEPAAPKSEAPKAPASPQK